MTRAVADVVGEEPGAETVPVAREVADLARKLREDQFRIALVAPFQSGKSTTFDALLGGEEISPRGDNTATSATVVHGRHTTDPALAGKAEVTWKNDAELLLMLPEKLLMPQLAALAPERFGEGATLDDLRLDDPRDLDLLRRATARAWRRGVATSRRIWRRCARNSGVTRRHASKRSRGWRPRWRRCAPSTRGSRPSRLSWRGFWPEARRQCGRHGLREIARRVGAVGG